MIARAYIQELEAHPVKLVLLIVGDGNWSNQQQ